MAKSTVKIIKTHYTNLFLLKTWYFFQASGKGKLSIGRNLDRVSKRHPWSENVLWNTNYEVNI